jgi:hypothetical protein
MRSIRLSVFLPQGEIRKGKNTTFNVQRSTLNQPETPNVTDAER